VLAYGDENSHDSDDFMCGIAGYFGPGPFDPRPFLSALAHRGPDATGVWSSGAIGGNHIHLVHTRLAVLDLTDAGSQPMQLVRTNEDGWCTVAGGESRLADQTRKPGYAIAYNGEIYNFATLRTELQARGHTFASTGDTEVLLRGYAEWGRGVFAKLDGIFAVLVYDGPARRLVMARDHLGIKPLYCARGRDGSFVFASQVRAIVDSKRWEGGVNRTALFDYLRFGSYQEPATVFSGISTVEPGCVAWMELDEGSPGLLRSEQYWSIAPGQTSSTCDWRAEHASLLHETVREQLVADVPVGVFLSGGLDSTLLLEIAAGEARERLTAFTVGGELTTHNETEIAARTAANLGVKHRLIHLTRTEQEEWTRQALLAMDQPSCDGVNTYVVSRASRVAGLIVALGGAGADEFHGAYGYAASLARLSRGLRAAGFLARPSGRLAAFGVGLRYGNIAKERLELMLAQGAIPWRLAQEKRRFFTPRQIVSLWPESTQIPQRWQPPLADEAALEVLLPETQITLAEARGYLLNTLLRDSDWATMANQQELRLPYLGRRYIELMLRMPTAMLAPKGGVLKPLLAGMISPANRALVNLPKTGFAMNYAELLNGSFRDEFHASCAWLNNRLGFRLEASRKLRELKAVPSGKTANRLWALFTLGRYLERFVR
jgi:asparagine synthase (glutamine-hydrolysing)